MLIVHSDQIGIDLMALFVSWRFENVVQVYEADPIFLNSKMAISHAIY